MRITTVGTNCRYNRVLHQYEATDASDQADVKQYAHAVTMLRAASDEYGNAVLVGIGERCSGAVDGVEYLWLDEKQTLK